MSRGSQNPVPDRPAGPVVIAIDGPSGSGKSTVARRLATELGLSYLDTGAMYRSVTLAVLEQGIDPADGDAVAAVARSAVVDLAPDGTVRLDGVDVTAAIRTAAVNEAVSAVAANQSVRAVLVDRQRDWIRERDGGVLEGRDIGTVVFPSARLKVYLTASDVARAARRARDEVNDDHHEVAQALARRDHADATRLVDPLRQADDAQVLDTTDLSIDEVVDILVRAARG
ncbi:MAG: (d)CMP kinase [Acidimicrobiales bacterium]